MTISLSTPAETWFASALTVTFYSNDQGAAVNHTHLSAADVPFLKTIADCQNAMKTVLDCRNSINGFTANIIDLDNGNGGFLDYTGTSVHHNSIPKNEKQALDIASSSDTQVIHLIADRINTLTMLEAFSSMKMTETVGYPTRQPESMFDSVRKYFCCS